MDTIDWLRCLQARAEGISQECQNLSKESKDKIKIEREWGSRLIQQLTEQDSSLVKSGSPLFGNLKMFWNELSGIDLETVDVQLMKDGADKITQEAKKILQALGEEKTIIEKVESKIKHIKDIMKQGGAAALDKTEYSSIDLSQELIEGFTLIRKQPKEAQPTFIKSLLRSIQALETTPATGPSQGMALQLLGELLQSMENPSAQDEDLFVFNFLLGLIKTSQATSKTWDHPDITLKAVDLALQYLEKSKGSSSDSVKKKKLLLLKALSPLTERPSLYEGVQAQDPKQLAKQVIALKQKTLEILSSLGPLTDETSSSLLGLIKHSQKKEEEKVLEDMLEMALEGSDAQKEKLLHTLASSSTSRKIHDFILKLADELMEAKPQFVIDHLMTMASFNPNLAKTTSESVLEKTTLESVLEKAVDAALCLEDEKLKSQKLHLIFNTAGVKKCEKAKEKAQKALDRLSQ
jgi:hypothetical protein